MGSLSDAIRWALPVDRLALLADRPEVAAERLVDAHATVAAAPANGLDGPVARTRSQFIDELASVRV